jgi:transposase InsO family protein
MLRDGSSAAVFDETRDRLPRAIGSIRRECIDHLIVLNEEHLRRILAKFAAYYNEWRPHASLAKDVPNGRPIERFGDIVARAIFGGLHHRYARIQFLEATGT